jgi:23S rRNA pseudouridine1911/1915/1917 synthase
MDEYEEENPDGKDLYEHFRIQVDKGQSLVRIDKFLTARIENISRNRIQNAADAGNIFVNGKTVKSNYRVKPNDLITILMAFPPRDIEILPENIPLDIVFEDDDIQVLNKPAGLVVHPGHGNFDGTLVNALTWHNTMLAYGEIRTPYLFPLLVHRIDKDTTGLMLIAKTELAQFKLAKQFFDHTIQRRYVALVWGDFKEDEGTVTGHVGRHLKDRIQQDVFPDGDYGKHAVTHYKVLERFGYVTLIECRLETGRTHQIRAHMKYIGHPLFNDELYGGDKIIKGTIFSKYKQFIINCFEMLPRQALHAKSLGFIHPKTNEHIYFDSELPADMGGVVARWREYKTNKELTI